MTPDYVDLPEIELARAEATVPFQQIPMVLPTLYDAIFGAFHAQGLRAEGHEQAYYEMQGDEMLVIAAVPRPNAFVATDAVSLWTAPAETTLHLRHIGPYSGLPAVYQKLHAFAAAEGHKVTSGRELYGGWSPYPQERITDVHIGIV
ncbi:MAG: GyrI-like domain-containing protein [Pseudomonadota bacterium]